MNGGLTVDYDAHEVTVDGRPVQLTPTESKLLLELCSASGRVVTHDQILRRVWGPLYSSDARLVRQYIKGLRRKLGDHAARPRYIMTETGVGYRMSRSSDPLIARE